MKTWLIIREGHPLENARGLDGVRKLIHRPMHKVGRELYLAWDTTESDGIREKHDIWIATIESAKRNGFEFEVHP